MKIAPSAFTIDELAEQQCSAVPQAAHETTELVTRIPLGRRHDISAEPVTHQGGDTTRRLHLVGVDPELNGQRLIEDNELWAWRRRRAPQLVHAVELQEARTQQWQRQPFGSDHAGNANERTILNEVVPELVEVRW